MTELRRECSDLRSSNKSMEIMLQNIAVRHYPKLRMLVHQFHRVIMQYAFSYFSHSNIS